VGSVQRVGVGLVGPGKDGYSLQCTCVYSALVYTVSCVYSLYSLLSGRVSTFGVFGLIYL
jgi:hypothetical protein